MGSQQSSGLNTVQEALGADQFASRFQALMDTLAHAPGRARLNATLHDIVDLMGFDGGAFLTFIREDESRESFKFTVACSPAWCQTYAANGWYALDPGLIYSQANTAPARIEDLPLKTHGQRDMMQSARAAGFVSGVVVPAHTSGGRSRLGVLYLGSGKEGYVNDQGLQMLKMYVRTLASELLDWWSASLRRKLVEEVRLSDDEIHLMRLVHMGYRSKEVSALMGGMSPNAIDLKISRITAKVGADSRKDAVKRLVNVGLIA